MSQARRPPTTVVLGVVLAAAAALRVWFLLSPAAAIDGDEAVTALMVRRILHGRAYAYLADQSYNGAIEQYLQAVVWRVLPQTWFTLRLPQVALSVLACWLVYRTGVALLDGSRVRALVAASLFAVGPWYELSKSGRSHGAYVTAQIIGLVALLAASRLRGSRTDDARALAVLGLVTGLAAWAAWSSAYLLGPALLWALPSLRRRPRAAVAALGAAVAGAAPALLWSLHRHRLPGLGGPQPHRTPWTRLRHLVSPVLGEWLGAAYRFGHGGWPRPIAAVAAAAFVALVAAACWRRRSGLLAVVTGRTRDRRPVDMVVLAAPVTVVLYVLTKYTWTTAEPRYLFAAYPALALGLAAALPRQPRAERLVGIGLVAVTGVSSVAVVAAHRSDGPLVTAGCLTRTADWLVAHGFRDVYSDFWTGMPLQVQAGDRLVVAPVGGGRGKFPEQRATVDAQPDVTYVAGHALDPLGEETDDVTKVRSALAAAGVHATEYTVGCTVVFAHWTPPARPWTIGLGFPLPDPDASPYR